MDRVVQTGTHIVEPSESNFLPDETVTQNTTSQYHGYTSDLPAVLCHKGQAQATTLARDSGPSLYVQERISHGKYSNLLLDNGGQ